VEKSQLDSMITRLVNTDDQSEVRQLYRQWSASYDDDLDAYGYVAPQVGVDLFEKLLEVPGANIHDAGCGTGQVGKLLHERGYRNIYGSDFSEDMLNVARTASCYKSLTQADFTERLKVADNYFDGIISIGVYTKRFKQIFLAEMLRTLKPGGVMLFSCRPLYYDEVADTVKALHAEEVISKSSVVNESYMVGQQASAYYISLHKALTGS